MQNYDVRDISLAPTGHQKIEWVRKNMPLLRGLEEEFRQTKPFEGVKISLSVHLEAKTAYLCLVLAAGGADKVWREYQCRNRRGDYLLYAQQYSS